MNRWLPLKVCFFIILPFLSSSVYAEYYMVYSAPPCCVTVKKHHYPVKKKYHKVKRAVHYKKPSRASVSVYYPNYPASCCVCQEVWVQGRWDCYGGCAPPAPRVVVRESYGYGYPHAEITYNPDLTTGDDDTWVNPNMNIDG